MDILNLMGFIIGVIGFIFAIYEYSKRKKVEDMNRIDAWLLYDQSGEVLARVQDLAKSVDQSSQSLDKELYKKIGATDCIATQMLKDTVKNIQKTEEVFNKSSIEKWQKEKRIHNDSHIHVFEHLIR